MVYLRNGELVAGRSWWSVSSLVEVFWTVVNAIGFFFQTLINPAAADEYKRHARKKGWDKKGGSGGERPSGGSGGGGGGPRGPRISGMSSLNKLDSTACGGGS
eukprot:jgi/Astpho2/3067/Aster-x0559